MAAFSCHFFSVTVGAQFADLADTGSSIGTEEEAEKFCGKVIEFLAFSWVFKFLAHGTGR
jgi:hypothetical protein